MDTFDKIHFVFNSVLFSFLILAFVYFLCSYDPPIVECTSVEAVVTDVSYKKVVPVGKIIIPARYIVHFRYDYIDGHMLVSKDQFSFYQNNIGCTIDCFLTVKTFSNGDVTKELTAIADY